MKSWRQLLTVGDSEAPSSSQLWFHIMNTAILFIYLFIGIKVALIINVGVDNAPALIDSMMWLTAIVSGIITSNKFANMIATLKFGAKENVSIDPK
jgi:hypothetical protein